VLLKAFADAKFLWEWDFFVFLICDFFAFVSDLLFVLNCRLNHITAGGVRVRDFVVQAGDSDIGGLTVGRHVAPHGSAEALVSIGTIWLKARIPGSTGTRSVVCWVLKVYTIDGVCDEWFAVLWECHGLAVGFKTFADSSFVDLLVILSRFLGGLLFNDWFIGFLFVGWFLVLFIGNWLLCSGLLVFLNSDWLLGDSLLVIGGGSFILLVISGGSVLDALNKLIEGSWDVFFNSLLD